MRTEKEIRELKAQLERLTGFICDFGKEKEFHNKGVTFTCDIHDTLLWVLEEETTEHFTSEDFLDMNRLKDITRKIEEREGKRLEDYE